MTKYIFLFFIISFISAAETDKNPDDYLKVNKSKTVKVWIFFKDKGPIEELSFKKASEEISEKALQRRSKIFSLYHTQCLLH